MSATCVHPFYPIRSSVRSPEHFIQRRPGLREEVFKYKSNITNRRGQTAMPQIASPNPITYHVFEQSTNLRERVSPRLWLQSS